MKRTPLKRGDSTLKKTPFLRAGKPLKKWSVASRLKEVQEDKDQLEQIIMFEKIWKPLFPHQRICYETGRQLYTDDEGNPYTTYFHHVLPKERYPQFRFSPWNIILVAPDVHSQAETSIDLCPKIKALYLHFMSKILTLSP